MNARLRKPLLALLLLPIAAYLFAQSEEPGVTTAPQFSSFLTPHDLVSGDFSLHYVDNGKLERPTLVFIHGTPGSWRSMRRVMADPRLQDAARLIAIDRPGWGDSQLHDGQRSVPDFDTQSALIQPLLQQLKEQSDGQALLLVGHSYGGSLAAYIAYRYPNLVDRVFMAASAIDPELGKPRWYNRAASTWLVSRFLRAPLLKANDEIWGVSPALERLLPWWANADIPMTFLQGDEDELVDPRNFNFAQSVLSAEDSTVIQLVNQGHLLQIQRSELMADLSLRLLERVTQL
jgi:pimeloyl-ACP methyl ester carboxylesterase